MMNSLYGQFARKDEQDEEIIRLSDITTMLKLGKTSIRNISNKYGIQKLEV